MFIMLSGPMQESDVWIDEDFDSLTWKLSEKNTSPVYTRDLTHPLGANVVSSRKARGGSDNLGDFYPEREWRGLKTNGVLPGLMLAIMLYNP